MILRITRLVLVSVMLALAVQAQAVPTRADKLPDHKLKSALMKREMPYRVILPVGYEGHKEKRYPVVYLLHGLTGHFDNWTELSGLQTHAANFELIIVTPEGDNGWYTDSATKPADQYESYIIKELIPAIDDNYRTINGRDGRAIAGLSMGGYGALKFGLKYPGLFSLAGSFSGALAITDVTDKNSPVWISASVMTAYGGAESETRKTNDLFRLLREYPAEKIGELPFIYVDCGTEDFLIGNNRDFLKILQEKKVPHEYRELPGIHNWKYWNQQVTEFLELSERVFSPKTKSAGV